MTDVAPEVTSDLEPTAPGFYHYSGGRQTMLFLLREPGDWLVIFNNGEMKRCAWGYIEQALGVWTLVRVSGDDG